MKWMNTAEWTRALALAVATITMSSTVLAESDLSQPVGEVEAAVKQKPTSKVFGTLDLRAEYYTSIAQADTSNYFQIGYQFNPNLKVSWYQGFDSNIYNSNYVLGGTKNEGVAPMLDQSFLRTRMDKIWTSGDLSFSYENRIYAPTWRVEQQRGNITRLYNAFKLSKKVNNFLTLTAVEVFTPQIFSVAGTGSVANPWLQNRVYAIADMNITNKLSLSIPLLWYTDFNREFAGASNSGKTTNILYAWPELDYALTENVTLGVAYVTDNMVKADFSEFTFSNAFKNSIVQAIVTTNL